MASGDDLEILRISGQVEVEQREALTARRADRDQNAVDVALARLVEQAAGTDNLIPAMLAAAEAEATLGEICQRPARDLGCLHGTGADLMVDPASQLMSSLGGRVSNRGTVGADA